ncbi:MAG: flagellar export chaperone FliS [Pseudomonadota bacterium]
MNAYNQYHENQILSASPEQILLLLYDGAIRFTRQAIHGLEEGNLTLFHHGIKSSMAIITEFSNSLDHAIGGEIAENLDALYNFMIRELTLANLHQDIDKLHVVDKLLVDLRATWGEAAEINKAQMAKELRREVPDNYVSLSISR